MDKVFIEMKLWKTACQYSSHILAGDKIQFS